MMLDSTHVQHRAPRSWVSDGRPCGTRSGKDEHHPPRSEQPTNTAHRCATKPAILFHERIWQHRREISARNILCSPRWKWKSRLVLLWV